MVLSVNPLQQANDHLDRIKAYEAANEAKMTEMRATHAHQLKSVMRNVDSRSRNKKKKGRGARSQKSKAFGQHMTNNEIGTETVMKERMDAELGAGKFAKVFSVRPNQATAPTESSVSRCSCASSSKSTSRHSHASRGMANGAFGSRAVSRYSL